MGCVAPPNKLQQQVQQGSGGTVANGGIFGLTQFKIVISITLLSFNPMSI
jgi:hypothetical protein